MPSKFQETLKKAFGKTSPTTENLLTSKFVESDADDSAKVKNLETKEKAPELTLQQQIDKCRNTEELNKLFKNYPHPESITEEDINLSNKNKFVNQKTLDRLKERFTNVDLLQVEGAHTNREGYKPDLAKNHKTPKTSPKPQDLKPVKTEATHLLIQ